MISLQKHAIWKNTTPKVPSVSGSKRDNDDDDSEIELEAVVGSDIDMEVEPEMTSHTMHLDLDGFSQKVYHCT